MLMLAIAPHTTLPFVMPRISRILGRASPISYDAASSSAYDEDTNANNPRASEFAPVVTTLEEEAEVGEDGLSEPLVLLGGFSQGEHLIDERELAGQCDESLKASLSAGDLETAIQHRIEVDELRSRDPRARYNDLHEQLQLCLEEEDDAGATAAMDQIRMVKTFLPEHNLEGLWVGRSGTLKKQVIRISYQDDMLIGTKAYSDNIVPLDEVIFKVNLEGGVRQPDPIKVEDVADRSLRQLERFKAQGRVVDNSAGSSQPRRSHWVPGQLIIVGDHFAFAWLPLGVQIFFMRVPDNIASQLETLEKDREMLTRLMSNSVEANTDEGGEEGEADFAIDGLDFELPSPKKELPDDNDGELCA